MRDAEDARDRYRFGPLERRGLVAGWRAGQIAAVATSLVLGVFALRSLPTMPGTVAALVVVAAGVAVATWPLGGRTIEEWLPDVVRHVTGGRGDLARRGRGDVAGRGRRRVPAPFATLRVLEARLEESSGRGPVGVVHDRGARTYTVVLPASGPGFALLGRQGQAGRVQAWAGVLASLSRQGGLVHRVQWVERSLPDAGVEIRRHFANRRAPLEDAAVRSYASLLESETLTARRHEVLVALSIHAGHAARAVRAAGGGDTGACAVLLREAASLCRRLRDAGVTTAGPLGPRALSAALRRGYNTDASMRARADADADPLAGRTGAALLPGSSPPAPGSDPWPAAMAAEWSRVRVDGTWQASYWVAEWPRIDVGPDFLGPLLLADVRRTVSVVMEPVSPVRAARRVEQARTADIADAELRRRGGFLATARRRREEEVLVHREAELADGHAQYRFTGYVTVTVEDPDELDDACGQTEQAAARAGLELRRCYGDQAYAFSCSLPLGRGLA